MSAKRCPRCGETKDTSAFHANSRMADGYATYCRECRSRYMRAYRAAHRTETARERVARLRHQPTPPS